MEAVTQFDRECLIAAAPAAVSMSFMMTPPCTFPAGLASCGFMTSASRMLLSLLSFLACRFPSSGFVDESLETKAAPRRPLRRGQGIGYRVNGTEEHKIPRYPPFT